MNLKQLTFQSTENGCVPEKVTVEMTVEEALWIAKVSGKQRGESPHRGIFSCLTNDVFNRYWDDGVDDASGIFRFETPPIQYDD